MRLNIGYSSFVSSCKTYLVDVSLPVVAHPLDVLIHIEILDERIDETITEINIMNG